METGNEVRRTQRTIAVIKVRFLFVDLDMYSQIARRGSLILSNYCPVLLRAWNLEPGTWNLEPGTWNLEPGTWNLEPNTNQQHINKDVHIP